MLSIKDIKKSKKMIKELCHVIVFIEKSAIPNNENKDKYLKKYKMRDILERDGIIRGEKLKSGSKSLIASQFIENKKISKKNISLTCIFLKAKYT